MARETKGFELIVKIRIKIKKKQLSTSYLLLLRFIISTNPTIAGIVCLFPNLTIAKKNIQYGEITLD